MSAMQHANYAISYDFLPYKSYALTITIGVALIDRGDCNLQSTTPGEFFFGQTFDLENFCLH